MKRLIFKNTLLYSIPDILTKLLPFLTLPIVTTYLTIEEIGLIGIYGLVIALYLLFSQFGLRYVINSQWFKLSSKNKKILLYNLFLINLFLSTIAILVFYIIYNYLTPFVIGESWESLRSLWPFIIIQVFFAGFKGLFDSYMIITKNVSLVLKLSVFSIILNTSLFLYMVITTADIYYILATQALVVMFIGLIHIYIILKNSRYDFKKYFWYKTLFIGYPIFIRSIFNFTRNRYDKIYVANLLGSSSFAIYNFAYSVISSITLLTTAFDKSFSPHLYEKIAKKDTDLKDLVFMIYLYFTAIVTVIVIFTLIGKPFISLLSNDLFNEAYEYILLLFITILVGIPTMGSGHILVYYEKTKLILINTVLQTTLIMFLIIMLSPSYGIYGIIFSIIIGRVYYSGFEFFYSRKLTKIRILDFEIFFYVVLFTITIITKVVILGSTMNIFMVLLYLLVVMRFIYHYKKIKFRGKETSI